VQERRKSGRARVLKGAKLVVGKASILDCVVRNLNYVGARVELTNSASVPENAQLTFDGGQSFRPCQIVWRKLGAVGLAFVNSNER
jgi:hypothetical protein